MASTFVLPPAFVQANAGSSFGNPETLGEDLPNLYTRWSNPTVRQLEVKLASLEEGEDAVAFGSGMAASSALLLHKLKAGDHAVISDVAYVGVAELARDSLPKSVQNALLGVRPIWETMGPERTDWPVIMAEAAAWLRRAE